MASLSDLIAGQGATTPAPLPQGPAPQPQGQDPGFQQRKQGWAQALQDMVKDPVNAMTMVQIGSSMANIQPGQNPGAAVANALREGMAHRGRYQQIMDAAQANKRKEEREETRIGLEEKRFGLSEEELEMNQRRADNEATYKMGQLGLSEDRNRIEREKLAALKSRAAGGSAGGKPSDKDKLAFAIASKFKVPADEARIIAESYGSRAALITKYTEAARMADEENAAMLGSPSTFDELATRKRIAATVDASMGLSPGTLVSEGEKEAPKESEFKVLFESLSPEQKAAYDARAETDPEFGTWWNTNKESLK